MRIGDLARTTGVTTPTIRFYERRGLLPSAEREANGYRRYNDEAAAQVRFIRASQAAGLTLTDITGIISMRRAGETPCAHVAELLASRLEEVRARKRELTLLEAELQQLIRAGQILDPAECGAGAVCEIIPRLRP